MPIRRLDHVNLRTTRLPEMIAWYRDVLGLVEGPRPDFGFPGAWMYAGDHPIVHLVAVGEEGMGSDGALKLEHFALAADDLDAFRATIREAGIAGREVLIEDFGLRQINVWDPDGNHIHVDFAA